MSESRVMSETLVNEARFGFTRNVGTGTPAMLLNPSSLGIANGIDEPIGLPQITVGGGLNFGGPANFLTSRTGTTFTVSDMDQPSAAPTHAPIRRRVSLVHESELHEGRGEVQLSGGGGFHRRHGELLQRDAGGLVRNVALMAGYFGGRGTHLRISRNLNQPVDGVRPFPALSAVSPIMPGAPLGNITQIEGSARSSYRAWWMSLRGRVSDRLRVTGSYTPASSKDYNSLNNQGVVVQDGYDMRGDWGPSDFDARHRAFATAIYELPFVGNALVEGWQIALIVQAQSGSPVNIVTSNSTLNGIANTVRPDVTGPVTTIGDVNRWFDTTPFVAANHFGDWPRNAVVGPRFDNTDGSIAKMTPIGAARVELRLDVFNLFNHPNFGQPGNVVGSRNFGVITSTRFPTGELGSSRQIQCSARVTF